MLGGGLTTTVHDIDLVVSAAEVAVTVTVRLAETDGGALNVAAPVVEFVKVPQAVPAQAVPDMLQVTPWLLESFATVAEKATVCPWSIDIEAEGVRETEIAGGVDVLLPLELPPQPYKSNIPNKIKPNLFMTVLPPGISKVWVLITISLRQRKARGKCFRMF